MKSNTQNRTTHLCHLGPKLHTGLLGMYSVAYNSSLNFAFCVQELSDAQFWKIPSTLQGATRWVAKLCAAR